MFKTISIILVFVSILSSCSDEKRLHVGVRESRLTPCPESPNCVSSQGSDSAHAVAPLAYETEAGKVIADLKVVVGSMKGATIASESALYLHVVFQSDVFRFIDDVEFVVDEAVKVVHVRSASRVGYYDFGVNRRRVEKIRQAWNQKKSYNKQESTL
jgi:uncharacterized protein (DUF1499 family)